MGNGIVAQARKGFRGATEVAICKEYAANQEAELATRLIERWGIVAAEPDGEDGSGRQKLRRMSATELVDEACVVAANALAEFRHRGWLLALPLPELEQEDEKKKLP